MRGSEEEDFYIGFLDVLFYSKIFNINIYLLETVDFPDFERVGYVCFSNPDWVFHYIIPKDQLQGKSNLIIIGLWSKITPLMLDEINPNTQTTIVGESYSQVMLILKNEIQFNNHNIYNHSCKFTSQIFFGTYLDICTYSVDALPPHWGRPTFISEIPLDTSKIEKFWLESNLKVDTSSPSYEKIIIKHKEEFIKKQ